MACSQNQVSKLHKGQGNIQAGVSENMFSMTQKQQMSNSEFSTGEAFNCFVVKRRLKMVRLFSVLIMCCLLLQRQEPIYVKLLCSLNHWPFKYLQYFLVHETFSLGSVKYFSFLFLSWFCSAPTYLFPIKEIIICFYFHSRNISEIISGMSWQLDLSHSGI